MRSETDIYRHEGLLEGHLIVVNMSVRHTWSPVIACFLQAERAVGPYASRVAIASAFNASSQARKQWS
jgi:hypothetical protein